MQRDGHPYGFGSYIDLAYDAAFFPIIEYDELRRSSSQQYATMNALGRKVGSNRFDFLEVTEELDLGRTFAHGILTSVVAPNKLQSRTEALVAPRQRGVDDVFAFAANHHKAAVGVVLEHLWKDFTRAEILCGQHQAFTIGRLAYNIKQLIGWLVGWLVGFESTQKT
jgi:hypothetical protein